MSERDLLTAEADAAEADPPEPTPTDLPATPVPPTPPAGGATRHPVEPVQPGPAPRRHRPSGGAKGSLRRRVRALAHDVEERAARSSRRRVQVPLTAARIIVHVLRQYIRERCPQQASSLSFQTILSMVPLLAVAMALLRMFDVGAESRLVEFIGEKIVPLARVEIADRLQQFSHNVTLDSIGLVGLIGVLLIAFTMINSLETIINHIWRAERRRSLTQKFVVFYATATIGPFLLAFSLYQAARFGLTSGVAGFAFSFLSTMAGFFLLNYFLPSTKVQVRAAFLGSATATLLFELAKHGFSVYVTEFAFDRYSGIYGALAVLPLWLVWIYYCWLVVLFGVVVTHAAQNLHLIQRLDRRGGMSLENELLSSVNGVVATRIMTAICQAYTRGDKALSRNALSDRFALSVDVVDRILTRLKASDLILEIEGDVVGLIPARPPSVITVAEILAAFRGRDLADFAGDRDSAVDRLLADLEERERTRTREVRLSELV